MVNIILNDIFMPLLFTPVSLWGNKVWLGLPTLSSSWCQPEVLGFLWWVIPFTNYSVQYFVLWIFPKAWLIVPKLHVKIIWCMLNTCFPYERLEFWYMLSREWWYDQSPIKTLRILSLINFTEQYFHFSFRSFEFFILIVMYFIHSSYIHSFFILREDIRQGKGFWFLGSYVNPQEISGFP